MVVLSCYEQQVQLLTALGSHVQWKNFIRTSSVETRVDWPST